jgi:hypothetical protein
VPADWRPLFLDALRAGSSIAMAARSRALRAAQRTTGASGISGSRRPGESELEVGRVKRIRERTPHTDGAPDQLAARIRAVRHALERRRLREFTAELWGVERLLDRQARDHQRQWLVEHGLTEAA